MRISEVTPHIGNIVLLDLVSGMQVCTEIKSVIKETGKVITGKVVIFQVSVEPQDPSRPPDPSNPMVQKVATHPYGGPFCVPHTEMPFDVEHIMMMHSPVAAVEKGYLQATSGIAIAGAGALNGPTGLIQ
jgi:hypothetical protein